MGDEVDTLRCEDVKVSHLIDSDNMLIPGEDAKSYPDIEECQYAQSSVEHHTSKVDN